MLFLLQNLIVCKRNSIRLDIENYSMYKFRLNATEVVVSVSYNSHGIRNHNRFYPGRRIFVLVKFRKVLVKISNAKRHHNS